MRERAEEALRRSREDVARSNKELDEFASIASHNLRAPLRAVSGFVNLLAQRYKGKLDVKADEDITDTVNAAKRRDALLHDLHVYSRIGTHGKQFATVDLGVLLMGSIDNLNAIIDENEAVVTSDELPHVSGYDTQLIQLFRISSGMPSSSEKRKLPTRSYFRGAKRG